MLQKIIYLDNYQMDVDRIINSQKCGPSITKKSENIQNEPYEAHLNFKKKLKIYLVTKNGMKLLW